MARISGVDLPNKRLEIALTYLYGIGRSTASKICSAAKIDPSVRIDTLSTEQLALLRKIIEETYVIEGRLRTLVSLNIKRLMDIGCHRGIRHRKGLPVRGQRTRTNARTRKGKRKTVAGKRKA